MQLFIVQSVDLIIPNSGIFFIYETLFMCPEPIKMDIVVLRYSYSAKFQRTVKLQCTPSHSVMYTMLFFFENQNKLKWEIHYVNKVKNKKDKAQLIVESLVLIISISRIIYIRNIVHVSRTNQNAFRCTSLSIKVPN